MNIERHLILIRNKDQTKNIEFCKYDKGKWHIKFYNNHRIYRYNYNNVEWEREPLEINSHENAVYYKDEYLSGVSKILRFNTHYRLIFQTGYMATYPIEYITIEQSSLKNKTSKHLFQYLTHLASNISDRADHENSFLSNEYEKITQLSPKTVLANYLSGHAPALTEQPSEFIFPFGLNKSQKAAINKAFNHQISMIEGPPGTGKTQTILNIIANAVINNKTVAIASNNNSATANVMEKLETYDLDFFAAYLGNKVNQETFIENQTGTLPQTDDWLLDRYHEREIKNKLKKSQDQLDKMLTLQNKQAKYKEHLAALETEFVHFEKYYNEAESQDIEINSLYPLTSQRLMHLIISYKRGIEKGNLSFGDKIYHLFRFGIYNFSVYKQQPEAIVTYLQKRYYDTKKKELKIKIDDITEQLDTYNFSTEIDIQTKYSMQLFKSALAKKYNYNNRPIFNRNDLWQNSHNFTQEYPVILSTTHSMKYTTSKNFMFDYLLIDEASQVDIVTGALALSAAKNVVIVGDHLQLPHVVPESIKKVTDQIFTNYNVHPAYNYADQNLLSSVRALFPNVARTLLREHYRCHPKIIKYCNQKYYNGELIVLTEEQNVDNPLILYETVKGNHARGRMNERQVDVIYNEIIPDQDIDPNRQSVGIIAPYRDQANLLEQRKTHERIEADTVHKYQGRERDIIILSTVANDINKNDFVDQPNLINVAVSRAVNQLIIVLADGSDSWHDTNIGDLVRYVKYNNFDVIKSDIRSVFDLLYKDYSKKLMEILNKNKQVSKFASENLMNIVITDLLKRKEFQHLSHVLHQPLRMLIRDAGKLTDDEANYAMNILTHTDFVIYNNIDKMPILVVEVDGHAFHAANPVQLKRDAMKDRILEKYNIPILRMKTTESNEKERLKRKLRESIMKR